MADFSSQNLLGSSHFPSLPVTRFSPGPTLLAFEDIFTRYSKLELSFIDDRPVALSGLAKRLETFYRTPVTCGIVHRYLHKSLLWQRSGTVRMQKVQYTKTATRIPSWSWLAVNGAICYNVQHVRSVWWNQALSIVSRPQDSQISLYVLQAPVWTLENCFIESSNDTNCRLRDRSQKNLVGWLRFDQYDHTHTSEIGLISIAKHIQANHGWGLFGEEANVWKEYAQVKWHFSLSRGTYHYVLLVVPNTQSSESTTRTYSRVGVGVILEAWINNKQNDLVDVL